MSECLVCRSKQTELLLEFGRQPVSSQFITSPNSQVAEHDLTLAFCPACGVVQLAQPFPFQDLVPRFEWMTYREPEDHLDAVVDKICGFAGLKKDSAIAGISFKDQTTLERMRKRGYSNIWSLDLHADLDVDNPNAKIESIQALLTPSTAGEIVARRGTVDLLIARHIVEHAESPWRLISALSKMLSPNGYLILEVPDCTANLKRQDYSMIWEEHSLYFTPETLPELLVGSGCISRALEVHPFPFEDVIVLYGQNVDCAESAPSEFVRQMVERSSGLANEYAAAFNRWSSRYRSILAELTSDGRRVAAYGAGHLTCTFINLHGLSDYFAFVVDDTAHKQGLFMPGSRLPIVSRDSLTTDKVSACFLGMTPLLEDRIIANNAHFSSTGGKFYSMFVDSPRSIRSLV